MDPTIESNDGWYSQQLTPEQGLLMKSTSTLLLFAAISTACASATAQTSTDEARAIASASNARQLREALDRPPTLEPVAPGDYRAQAHQEQRLQQWEAAQSEVRAYQAGVRSQPLPVNSTDTARAEAHRLHVEQILADRASGLKSFASGR
jgi:hypothetical protein